MTLNYTGVGSRTTPPDVLAVMALFGQKAAKEGWTLRSGGAKGADVAFERLVPQHRKQIFYPNPDLYDPELWEKARNIASQVHPAWYRLKPFVQHLHTRNVFQVLGPDLNSPSTFLICFTHDGAQSYEDCSITTGGTGTAIKIAALHNIEVVNMQRPEQLLRVISWIDGDSQ